MVKEEEFLDDDYEEIAGSENETDLITRLKTPVNLVLLSLIILTVIAIILALILL